MENHENTNENDQENGIMKEPLLNHNSKSLGGLRTLPFIIASEGFERAAYFGLQPNMILYLLGAYSLDMATGSNIIFLWAAATNFTPIIGAFLADSYMGRFWMVGFGSISALLGMILLWSTTALPGVKPPVETPSTLFQLMYLCLSLGLMSIGAGGIRSSALAFGGDQLQNIVEDGDGKPGSSRALASLFNWFYFSFTVAMLFAMTCIVYIQDHFGWVVGFGVPVSFMLVSTFSFFLASSFYVKVKPVASVLVRPAQVIVASWRNRDYKLSNQLSTECRYHVAEGSAIEVPTEKLRFLNKACIIKDHSRDPWSQCTTDQVEEFKSIMKVIPLWSTAIVMGVITVTLSSFVVLQAKSMDRHVFTPTLEIPSASFGTFALVSFLIWLVLYERVFIPLASKYMGKPVCLDALTRAGIGLLFSVAAMLVAGVVESARLSTINSSTATKMSALWLVPQLCLVGLADGVTAVSLIEFLYSEFPRSMSSISTNLYGLCLSVASIVASLILSVVDYVSKQGGKASWVSSDPNEGHYDYYYWIIAGLSLLNYMYFLLCRRAFREDKRISQDQINMTN